MKNNNPFYKTKRWRNKREVILKRDEYMCRECKRYGKTTAANTVHHVFPYETHPEYKYNNNNLISVCNQCHNKYHNRFDDTLTETGMNLQRRLETLIVK